MKIKTNYVVSIYAELMGKLMKNGKVAFNVDFVEDDTESWKPNKKVLEKMLGGLESIGPDAPLFGFDANSEIYTAGKLREDIIKGTEIGRAYYNKVLEATFLAFHKKYNRKR